jgi:uncharacterized protein YgiM (DUF1202 family)
MSDPKIPNQWQLQETGEQQDQWRLLGSDNVVPAPHMRLQQATGPIPPTGDWRPVDIPTTVAPPPAPPARRGGWIFGLLVLLALGAVGAYLVWFYADDLGIAGATSAVETPAATAGEPGSGEPVLGAVTDTVGAAIVVTPTIAPTPLPPTPTPAPPTPTATPALFDYSEATVVSQYGVNARTDSTVGAEIVQLLENNTVYPVVQGPVPAPDGSSWVQVALPDQRRGWVSAEFVQLATRQLTLAELEPLLSAAGMAERLAEIRAAAQPAAPAETAPITGTAPVTGTAPLTTSTAPTSTGASLRGGLAAAAPVSVTATITLEVGVNAREAPTATAALVQLVLPPANLQVIARTPAGDWVQVRLADGRLAWVSADFVQLTGNVNQLPAAGAASTAASAAPAAAAPVTATTTISGAAQAEVTYLAGLNARPSPSLSAAAVTLLETGTRIPAIGRTANGAWVQVILDDGTTAWVQTIGVTVTPGGVDALPITE